jgi:glycosyltransferase involved in cell wall biosynthesis
MAAYNGEKYLPEQMRSIISQLDQNDELVISVDPSVDQTEEIARSFAKNDNRIQVYKGPGMGVIKNFENALKHVSGEYIFLSDQDDVWNEEKISTCLTALKSKRISAVIHDAFLTNENLEVKQGTVYRGKFCSGAFCNIIKNRYIGCCMVIKQKVLTAALPFPINLPMHDQWLGLIADRMGEVVFVDTPLVYYRRHAQTVTGRTRANTLVRLKWRISITIDYLKFVAKGCDNE